MADRKRRIQARGFSLVELLVALVFTMVLMAGMATVFKTSLSTFHTSGEKLSTARRNRMALDLLEDDLNNAGMYLTDLSTPPSVTTTNPAFYISPNPTDLSSLGVTQGGDELFFYLDEPLPFEGKLKTGSSGPKTAAELVNSASAPDAINDFKYTVDCGNSNYAQQVKVGQLLIFKDSWEAAYITSIPTPPSGSQVSVVVGADPLAQIAGRGPAGIPVKWKHLSDCGVVFVNPAQMVRYSIQGLQLDPANAATIPCLVRDQGVYSGSGFVAAGAQQIITENVSGFRIYLSADSGRTWVGGTGFADWSAIRGGVDGQLSSVGRQDYKTTQGNEQWFRSIPALVRVDVTTRTAMQRTEYANTATPTLAHYEKTQSLVMVPRHFGLTMN